MPLFLLTGNEMPILIFRAETKEDAIEKLRDGMTGADFRKLTNAPGFVCVPLTADALDRVTRDAQYGDQMSIANSADF